MYLIYSSVLISSWVRPCQVRPCGLFLDLHFWVRTSLHEFDSKPHTFIYLFTNTVQLKPCRLFISLGFPHAGTFLKMFFFFFRVLSKQMKIEPALSELAANRRHGPRAAPRRSRSHEKQTCAYLDRALTDSRSASNVSVFVLSGLWWRFVFLTPYSSASANQSQWSVTMTIGKILQTHTHRD